MIQDWVAFGLLIHAAYRGSLTGFVSEAGGELASISYTWLIWHELLCSSLFLASHSTMSSPNTSHLMHCCLGPGESIWFNDLRD